MTAQHANPRSLLVYIDSTPDTALGENIRKLPFLWALRKTFPQTKISWVAGIGPAQFKGILAPLVDGAIDEIITDLDLPDGPSPALLTSALAGRHFDLILDTQKNIWRTLALKRISHDRFITAFWRYSRLVSSAKPSTAIGKPRHLVDQMMALLSAATGKPIKAEARVHLPEDRVKWADKILPTAKTYVGIAPGAGRRDTGKLWDFNRFATVAADQAEKGRTVLFILGPDERDWVAPLAKAVPTARFPLDDIAKAGGPVDPAMTMALGCKLAVGLANCSGTGHMLAGGGAPMVSLFGPTNPIKQAPYTDRLVTLWGKDFGGDINAIPVTAVSEALDRIISQTG